MGDLGVDGLQRVALHHCAIGVGAVEEAKTGGWV